MKKGANPKPKKNLKLDIQKNEVDQPLTKDDSNFGNLKARPEKADSLN